LDKTVDFVFSVAGISSFLEVDGLFVVSALGGAQFERPQEFVHSFELLSDGEDLVDDIFDADDSIFAEFLSDQVVVGDGDSLPLDLQEASLIQQVANGFEIRRSVSDVRLDEFEHSEGGSVQSHKRRVVDLFQAQELQDFPRLRIDTVDTSDSNDDGELGFGLDEEVASGASLAPQVDNRSLLIAILSNISLGSFEDRAPQSPTFDFQFLAILLTFGQEFLSAFALLENGLGDGNFFGVGAGLGLFGLRQR